MVKAWIVVMWPRSMPTRSLSTLATGARQLVVQDALLTTVCSGAELVLVDAEDDGEVGPVGRGRDQHPLGAGAEMAADAFSLLVKMPVHSRTMSTPSSPQGSLARSRSASTLTGARDLPAAVRICSVSPSSLASPGKRPCTLS